MTSLNGSRRIIALDAETTGTSPATDRIVELCLAEVNQNLQPISQWTQRFNPTIPIPEDASQVHGIQDQDVATQPEFRQHAPRIQRLLHNSTLIAYNGCRFDIPLLDAELRRAGQGGLHPNHPIIDPYLLFIEDQPRTLGAAVETYLGRTLEQAHQAKADVEAMLDVLRVQAIRRSTNSAIDLIHRPKRKWLDHDHCFYEDDEGATRLGFGKHRGERANENPAYLRWMMAQDFSLRVQATALNALQGSAGCEVRA